MDRFDYNQPNTRERIAARRKSRAARVGSDVRPGARRAVGSWIASGRIASLLLLIAALGGLLYIATAPRFTVRAITVDGAQAMKSSTVADLAGVRGQSIWLVDTQQIVERLKLQFRAELFNIFNHTNYGMPGQTFSAGPDGKNSSATFGVITSARDPRIIQLGARLILRQRNLQDVEQLHGFAGVPRAIILFRQSGRAHSDPLQLLCPGLERPFGAVVRSRVVDRLARFEQFDRAVDVFRLRRLGSEGDKRRDGQRRGKTCVLDIELHVFRSKTRLV